MNKEIVINPITRIEGHAKITIFLKDDDSVSEARFHVTDFEAREVLRRTPILNAQLQIMRHLPS
jgi:coenzyme F420-reducing hydrogenase alpha subunit